MPKFLRFAYTDRYGPLPEATWNFSRVPDAEVVACCLWEYARESKTLRLASDIHTMNTRGIRPEGTPAPAQEQLAAWVEQDVRTRRRVTAERFDYEKFLKRFWDFDLGYIEFYDLVRRHLNTARPFQHYTKKTRRYLVSKLTETHVFNSLTQACVGDLEILWKENCVELLEIRSRVRSTSDDSEDGALFNQSVPASRLFGDDYASDRKVTVAFTIDFSRFANTEIETAFRRWLLTHRPRRWRKPVNVFPTSPRRGRKINDYRVALDRLGIMRLLNQLPPSELRDKIPAAWKLYGHKAPDFRREIRAAVRFFRERFPFLPPQERPDSEQRFTKWWRPLQKVLEKLEVKLGRK
ncbi:MAG: hypothetical protein ABIZ81_11745 [Opitutaceae bacterium]